MEKDNIYLHKKDRIQPFEFNESVVHVFDDMISRSVPLYKETIKRLAQLAVLYYKQGTIIYDLGCSNGNFGICFLEEMETVPFEMIAVDSSVPMIEAYKKRLQMTDYPDKTDVCFKCENIQDIMISNSSVVIINLTLQFLSVHLRDDLIKRVYDALLPEGVLLITEKIVHSNSAFTKLQQTFHHRFKKDNGYSNLEISQKRDALENVLIPETIEEHRKRFFDSGFRKIDIWLKWFNFAAFICQK